MKILITGGSGFIASQIVTDLLALGETVVCCGRNEETIKSIFPRAEFVRCNFTEDIHKSDWILRLEGVDMVVNAVGILYHPNSKITWRVHYDTPKALFDACVEVGVKRIVQISALGIDDVYVDYATSKLAAEHYLQSLPISSVILRPSLVYGRGSYGGTSLFRGLAGLPGMVVVPGGGVQKFQPIHLADLSKALIRLMNNPASDKMLVTAVGPERLPMKQILTQLRDWLGFGKGVMVKVPLFFIRLGSYLGDLMPNSSMNATTFTMMQKDNVTSEQQMIFFFDNIGFKPRSFSEGVFSQPSTVQDHWHARLFFLKPALQISLAFMWIFGALCAAFWYPHEKSLALLEAVGVSASWQNMVLYGACALNALIGIGLLIEFRGRMLCVFQLLLIVIYSAIVSWKLPIFWLDPFGPIVKNIPIMVSILVYMAMASDR